MMDQDKKAIENSKPQTAEVRWTFWLWWILASTFGMVIGGLLGRSLGLALVGVMGDAIAALGHWFLRGAILGVFQWIVLSDKLSSMGWWVPATAIGGVLGWYSERGVFFGATIGVLVGVVQFFVLRRRLPSAAWWIVASGVAIAAGSVVFVSLPDPEFVVDLFKGVILTGTIPTAAASFVSSAITGGALVWLLRLRTP